ncbi:MAG: hypothetical protein PWP74_887 [Shewanella sp.]|nr:hypothetical protein [Shewanella sp.]
MPNPYRKGHYKAYLNDDSLIHYTVDDEVDSEVAHFPKFKITSFDLFVKAVASILDKNEITDDDWDY